MATCKVKLNSIENVKNFVDALKSIDGNFELVSGKYVIDAKSIMGIFSLDLTRPLELRTDTEIPEGVVPFLA
ncbi:MAG: HPr family phosphocarrier protein [Lachnospiraceae bacterium]|nr:HPr family phosphocarrier protein [Lachnospiraceae bacterium]